MKVCNTRNNCADRIWFHIKQQIINELSMDIVNVLFEIIYVIPYIIIKQLFKWYRTNIITSIHQGLSNSLFERPCIHHINFVTNPPNSDNLFRFRKYFIGISKKKKHNYVLFESISKTCFCKFFLLWTYPLKATDNNFVRKCYLKNNCKNLYLYSK